MSGRVPGDYGGWRNCRKGRGGGQASEIFGWNLLGEKEN